MQNKIKISLFGSQFEAVCCNITNSTTTTTACVYIMVQSDRKCDENYCPSYYLLKYFFFHFTNFFVSNGVNYYHYILTTGSTSFLKTWRFKKIFWRLFGNVTFIKLKVGHVELNLFMKINRGTFPSLFFWHFENNFYCYRYDENLNLLKDILVKKLPACFFL